MVSTLSPQPLLDESAAQYDELIRLLGQADNGLAGLRARAASVVAVSDAVSLGFSSSQLKTLCGILDHGRGRIRRRLSILDGFSAEGDEAKEPGAPSDLADPVAFMAEYRACCRILCKALSEALRVSNAPTVAMLSDFVLRLEKQLWLMDSPGNDPGSDRYRSVSLFLTC